MPCTPKTHRPLATAQREPLSRRPHHLGRPDTPSIPIPAGAIVHDASGRFVIPGLWDAHVDLSQVGPKAFPLLVSNGITSVRDMGSDFAEIQQWKAACAELIAQFGALTAAASRAGVPLLAGTDLGDPYVIPGFALHDELALMVRAGVPILAALQSATSEPARAFGLTDIVGAVATGKAADLLVLDADPQRPAT
jgi:imidazolonepropionase-like amidohydrolase